MVVHTAKLPTSYAHSAGVLRAAIEEVKPELVLVSAGLAAGGALAWFSTTFARSYIYGVQAHDGLTFAAVILVLAVASFLAAWLPARRAASVDPILALRSE